MANDVARENKELAPRHEDKELAAIGSIISVLQPLTDVERSRVLEYVLKRLQMSTM